MLNAAHVCTNASSSAHLPLRQGTMPARAGRAPGARYVLAPRTARWKATSLPPGRAVQSSALYRLNAP